jgi:hypothetical protein
LNLHRIATAAAALCFASVAVPSSAGAQAVAGPAVSLSAGARVYEGGSGEALAVALRAEYPISPFFLIEGAGSVANPPNGDLLSTTSVFELQAQAQLPGGRVVPYLGAGAGLARFRRGEGGTPEEGAVLSAGGGVRIGIKRQLGLVADARLRVAADGEAEAHGDVTVGVRYRFR